jgi:ribosomal protein S18 acetylase RimI-like enzyme
MEVFEFGNLIPAQRSELEGGELNPFGTIEPPLLWRAKDHHVGLRDAGGRMAASLGFVTTQVRVAGGVPFDVVGIGGVIVAPAYRREGHARTVIEAALERAETMGPEFALLFCFPDRSGLYERFGFSVVPREVRVQQPGGTARLPQLTMWRALRAGASWPPGDVEVLSRPF